MSVAEQHDWLQRQRSRRNVRKGGVTGAASVVDGPVLGSTLVGATMRPRPRRAPNVWKRRGQISAPGVTPFGRHIAYGDDPTRRVFD